MTLRGFIRALLLVTGIGCLVYFGWSILNRNLRQAQDSRDFDQARHEIESPPPTPAEAPKPASAPALHSLGRITVPRLHLVAMVEEGDDDETLSHAVGHIPGTALPGTAGNIGIAGHRDSFFRGLENLQRGDEIDLDTLRESLRYRVEEITVVEPQNTLALAPTRENILTLVTCFPFHYIGPAPRRYIVRALQIPRPLTNARRSGSSPDARSRPGSPQCPGDRNCAATDPR